jgi:hypothetical protein
MAIVVFSPIFMTEPLPNCFSMPARAISSAFSRSTVGVLSIVAIRAGDVEDATHGV